MREPLDRSRLSHSVRAWLRTGLCVLAGGVLLAGHGIAQDADASPTEAEMAVEIGMQVGQVHPYFRLPAVDDTESGYHSLADYRGRRLLLFHFASW